MSIESFLTSHMTDVEQIIATLPSDFSSHQFIQRFAHRFESDYITFLQQYQKPVGQRGAFQEVHKQIGRFLSKHETVLHIEKDTRTYTQNVFGDESDNQGWHKI